MSYSTPKPRRVEPGLYLMKILYTHVEKNRNEREFGIVEMEVVSSERPDVQPGERRIYAFALATRRSEWDEDWKFLSADATRGREIYVLAKDKGQFIKCVFSTVPITTHGGSDAYRYKEISAGRMALQAEGDVSQELEGEIAEIQDQIWRRLSEPTRIEIEKWIEARKKLL